jgi:nucleoside-diphosphate-sugar epimerase
MDGESAPAREGPSRGICAVTGASGYVGSRIASHLAGAGWDVRALCRTRPPIDAERVTHVRFDLVTGPTPEMLADADALVHAGYDFDHTRWSDIARVNVEGTGHLLTAAKNAGVDRIIYVSTVAAFPETRSMYGRAKLESEGLALALGAVVVRCGLVWGPHGGAMFGALRRAVQRLPVVPLVVPADLGIALVCEDDLAVLIERVLEAWPREPGRLFVAAASSTLTITDLLRSLSPSAGSSRRFVAVSWRIAWLALRCLEMLGVTPPFRSDSLLSLLSADSDPLARATADPRRYGVSFRPYSGA